MSRTLLLSAFLVVVMGSSFIETVPASAANEDGGFVG